MFPDSTSLRCCSKPWLSADQAGFTPLARGSRLETLVYRLFVTLQAMPTPFVSLLFKRFVFVPFVTFCMIIGQHALGGELSNVEDHDVPIPGLIDQILDRLRTEQLTELFPGFSHEWAQWTEGGFGAGANLSALIQGAG